MAIGVRTSEYEFDILDNPYVKVKIGKVKTDWVISENKDVSLRRCTDEEAYDFYGIFYYTFKGNFLCLDNPGNLKIKSSWFEVDYENPYFMVSECLNTTQ